jgi:hypothetical protein
VVDGGVSLDWVVRGAGPACCCASAVVAIAIATAPVTITFHMATSLTTVPIEKRIVLQIKVLLDYAMLG